MGLMFVSTPTYLMGDRESSVEPVVLDDGAASLRRADGADVCHAEGIAGVVSTEILDKEKYTLSERFTMKLIKTSASLFFPTITWS